MDLMSSDQLARAAEDARKLAEALEEARRVLGEKKDSVPGGAMIGRGDVVNLYGLSPANLILGQRRERDKYFTPCIFGEPAWDMLLYLYSAWIDKRRVNISKLTEAAHVPGTTALRWISILESKGYVARMGDPADRRSVHVALTEKGQLSMSGYFKDMAEKGHIRFQLPSDPLIYS
jgi:hypothetical protein